MIGANPEIGVRAQMREITRLPALPRVTVRAAPRVGAAVPLELAGPSLLRSKAMSAHAQPGPAIRGLGPCDVLTVEEAVAVIGIRRSDALRWMAGLELIHDVAGRRRVIAGDLAEAIRGNGGKVRDRDARVARPVMKLPLSPNL